MRKPGSFLVVNSSVGSQAQNLARAPRLKKSVVKIDGRRDCAGGCFFLDMLSLRTPLTRVQRPGIESPAGVHFGMMYGGTSIRVVVAREVLQTLGDGSVAKASLLAKFDLYRRQFEAIASDKCETARHLTPIGVQD
jgi:Protein of unknown function (DUF1488)